MTRGLAGSAVRLDAHAASPATTRRRLLAVGLGLAMGLVAITGQVLRLAMSRETNVRTSSAEPIGRSYARPDIVDRNGRVIATDVGANSLFADPALVLDRDEVAEKLAATLPAIDPTEVRRLLADRNRRFVWIRRGLTPRETQAVHDLGLPSLGFRREPKRVYPAGGLMGHIVGQVDPDNKGLAGLERYIDDTGASEMTLGVDAATARPLRLAIDLGVQHAVADELRTAADRYHARGAAGIVMDAGTGGIVAAASWPQVDPNVAGTLIDAARPDRVQGGVYELGSIFKALTIAMALDDGLATLDKTYDVTRPMTLGAHQIHDLHASAGPLTVRDIFVRSSNVGAAMMALEAGATRQLVFLARLGLTEAMRTEVGPVAPPLLPQRWGVAETATIGFGHGLAVAPLQFAAVVATLVNGGHRVVPSYLAEPRRVQGAGEQILSAKASDAVRELMRLNVTMAQGTGRRADVDGYRVGGKTGTADLPGKGGYLEKAVIASFAGALPMDAPRYVVLVSLFEPQSGEGASGGITAGLNAAPVTGAIVARVAPLLGILPRALTIDP